MKNALPFHITMILIPSMICAFLVGTTYLQAQTPQSATPQTEAILEAVCRIKSKEAANKAYQSCLSQKEVSQIDALKAEYELRLEQVKVDYENELRSLAKKQLRRESVPPAALPNTKTLSPLEGKSFDPVTIQVRPIIKPRPFMDDMKANPIRIGRSIQINDGEDFPEPIPFENTK